MLVAIQQRHRLVAVRCWYILLSRPMLVRGVCRPSSRRRWMGRNFVQFCFVLFCVLFIRLSVLLLLFSDFVSFVYLFFLTFDIFCVFYLVIHMSIIFICLFIYLLYLFICLLYLFIYISIIIVLFIYLYIYCNFLFIYLYIYYNFLFIYLYIHHYFLKGKLPRL